MKRNSQLHAVESMSRKQLLAIVRDPLAPAKIAWRAYNRLEGMES